MNHSQVNQMAARPSPTQLRKEGENRRPLSRMDTPQNQRHLSSATNDSARSDRTVDTTALNHRMDLAAELELVQNQLQMSEMRKPAPAASARPVADARRRRMGRRQPVGAAGAEAGARELPAARHA